MQGPFGAGLVDPVGKAKALQVFHSWALAICDEDALQVDRWQGFEDARATNLSGQAATWLVQGYECWCVVLVQVGRGITPLGGSTCHSEPLTRSSRR